jgi:hypothetical protein
MEGAVLAGKTLAHDFGVFIDQNGHDGCYFPKMIGNGF